MSPPFTALVCIDPNRISEEANRTNKDASIKLRIEPAALTIDALDVVPEIQHRASQLPVRVMLPNKSSVSGSPAVTMRVSGGCSAAGGVWKWGDAATRLAVPALGPGERWSASIAVRYPLRWSPRPPVSMPAVGLIWDSRPRATPRVNVRGLRVNTR